MDTNIEIKKEDPFSDMVVSQNEWALHHEMITMKRNSDAVLLEDDYDMAIKSETPFTKNPVKRIRSETNNWEIDRKIKIEEQTLVSDFGSQNEGECLPVDPVMKHNTDHVMNNKIEIKEEPWWLKTETSFVGDDNVGDFPTAESSRLCMEAVSGEVLGSETNFYNGKDHLECERQKSNVTEMPSAEHGMLEQSSKCNEGEVYTRALYLKQKHLIYKGKRSHKCNICAKRFSRLSHLERHNLIHEGKKAYQCNSCHKSFTQSSSLKTHTFIHQGIKPYQCKTCNKRFTQLSGLNRHKLIHESKKPHQCNICEKSFTQLSGLKRHNLIHEGKKPHECKTCNKSFTELSNLRKHNSIHEGKKPHNCATCDKSFTRFSYLKLHNLTHEGSKPHQCITCDKRFTQLSHLKRHNLIHEGKK